MRLSRLMLPLSIVILNVSNFIIIWLASHRLAASEFGEFSFWLVTSQLITVFFYEWLRTAYVRYSYREKEKSDILFAYRAVSIFLIISSAGLTLTTSNGIYIAVGAFSVGQGLYDLLQADFRATFKNISFVLLSFSRALLSILLLWIAFAFSANLETALTTIAAAFIISSFPSLFLLIRKHWQSKIQLSSQEASDIAKFGFGVSLANLLYYGTQSGIRGIALYFIPGSMTSGALFALDVCQRVFSSVGLAVNLWLLQTAIKRIEEKGQSEFAQAWRRQSLAVWTAVLPMFMMFVSIQDIFITIFVTPELSSGYRNEVILIAAGSAIFAFRTFAIDSAFILIGNSGGAFIGSLTGLIVTMATFVLFELFGLTDTMIAYALLTGAIFSCGASIFVLRRRVSVSLPYGDMFKVTVSSFVILLPGLNHFEVKGILFEIALHCLSFLLFLVILVFLDVGGIRSTLKRVYGR